MALLGPVVLLIVIVPLLVVCALAAAALVTGARLLLDGARAMRGARLAKCQAPPEPVFPTPQPNVELEPVP